MGNVMERKMPCENGSCPSLQSSFLSDVDTELRCQLRSNSVLLDFKKGQSIFVQGKEAEGLFCIRSGQVKLSLELPLGESITIKLFSDHGTLGQNCLISERHGHSATCLTNVETCYFSKGAVLQHISHSSSLNSKINSIISEEIQELTDVISNLRSKSIVQRLAESLVKMQDIFGTNEKGFIDVELTREEISNLVGSSVESVFRALSSFRTKKLIAFERKQIRILDEQRLRRLGKVVW